MTAESPSPLDEPGYRDLVELLRGLGSVAVACSGGLDSSLLLAVAHATLGERVLALTAMTPYMASWEIAEARELAATLGVRHQVLELPLAAEIAHNPPDRCYRCKLKLFSELKKPSPPPRVVTCWPMGATGTICTTTGPECVACAS
ncbi:MAG: asparagine synthase-related protein [Candidatus Competibacteraceae bacterium]